MKKAVSLHFQVADLTTNPRRTFVPNVMLYHHLHDVSIRFSIRRTVIVDVMPPTYRKTRLQFSDETLDHSLHHPTCFCRGPLDFKL